MKTLIETLRTAQEQESKNGFKNGNLWNDLEDIIYNIQNPSVDTEKGELYAGKTMEEILKK